MHWFPKFYFCIYYLSSIINHAIFCFIEALKKKRRISAVGKSIGGKLGQSFHSQVLDNIFLDLDGLMLFSFYYYCQEASNMVNSKDFYRIKCWIFFGDK